MKFITKLILTAALLLTAYVPINADMISVYEENDVLHNQDYYYSNGTKISYLNSALGWEFSLGQNMYTPENKWTKAPPPGDRPYAGWLYLGAGKAWAQGALEHYLEFNLGMIGPASYAYETQKCIHTLLNHQHVPEGWDSQVGNELSGTVLFQESMSLVDSPYFNIIPKASLCVGNLQDFAGLGTMVEAGYNVEQTLHNQISIKTIQPPKYRAFLFAGAEGRYICHNSFLGGGMFHAYDYEVDMEHWVADLEYGLCLQYKAVKIYFTTDWRTREFATEDSTFKPFDSIKLSVSF